MCKVSVCNSCMNSNLTHGLFQGLLLLYSYADLIRPSIYINAWMGNLIRTMEYIQPHVNHYSQYQLEMTKLKFHFPKLLSVIFLYRVQQLICCFIRQWNFHPLKCSKTCYNAFVVLINRLHTSLFIAALSCCCILMYIHCIIVYNSYVKLFKNINILGYTALLYNEINIFKLMTEL